MGESPDKEALGGSRAQTRAGAVDNEAADEDDALDQLRRFLSYLPGSAWEAPPIAACSDPAARREEELLAIVPREPPPDLPHAPRARARPRRRLGVRARRALRALGRSPALARLDGRPVGVLASDPHHYAGGLTADASDKLARFVDVCDAFRLPVVNFVDQPGFVIGTEAERAGTMRRGARALAAVHQARTPWCSVLVRKVYGVAGAGHGDGSRLNLRFAWPSGDWGSLPIDGGIEAAYRRELEAAEDPVALRAEIERAAERRALAVPHGRALQRRGDHRPARHAPAAVRLGGARARARRARGRPRPGGARHETVNRAALDRATAALDPPFAVVDLDAFDANAADLLRRAGATAVRLASKSVRCRALQRRALDAGLRGQLCFTLPEALWLADHGFDDLVVAYPTADRGGAARARARPAPRRDRRDGRQPRAPRPRGGGGRRPRARVPGRRRRLVAAARADPDRRQALAGAHARAGRRAGGRRGGAARASSSSGLMSYEAHIAGVGDAPPGRRAYGAAVRAMQRASARELAARRAAVVAAVRGRARRSSSSTAAGRARSSAPRPRRR